MRARSGSVRPLLKQLVSDDNFSHVFSAASDVGSNCSQLSNARRIPASSVPKRTWDDRANGRRAHPCGDDLVRCELLAKVSRGLLHVFRGLGDLGLIASQGVGEMVVHISAD